MNTKLIDQINQSDILKQYNVASVRQIWFNKGLHQRDQQINKITQSGCGKMPMTLLSNWLIEITPLNTDISHHSK